MDAHASEAAVPAKIRYVNAEWKGRDEIPRIGSRETRRANTSVQDVMVRDSRALMRADHGTLEESGFTLARLSNAIEDFRDDRALAHYYYPNVIDMAQRITGAERIFIYNHLIRTETPIDFNDGYARFAHCDYNVKRLDEMSEGVLAAHGVAPDPAWTYAWFNTWQPFDNPAIHNPMAFLDWSSLPADDVIDYFYTGRNKDSLVAAPVYNPDHIWRYVPEMTPDEILLFKQMDGRPGRSVYCPHTSFDNPVAPKDAPPRRSIETRLVAVFRDA